MPPTLTGALIGAMHSLSHQGRQGFTVFALQNLDQGAAHCALADLLARSVEIAAVLDAAVKQGCHGRALCLVGTDEYASSVQERAVPRPPVGESKRTVETNEPWARFDRTSLIVFYKSEYALVSIRQTPSFWGGEFFGGSFSGLSTLVRVRG